MINEGKPKRVKPELKKFMRSRAHTLKPVVIIGQHGVTPAVMNEINLALDHHELIKIRVNAADRDDRKLMVKQICSDSSADLIQAIGHVITLYRRSPHRN